MKKLFVTLFTALLLFQLACSDSTKGQGRDDTIEYLCYGIVFLASIWQKVTVADMPNFSFTNKDGVSLTPSCACPPRFEATTGKSTTYKPDFAFFVKRGTVNNLLIFFMGGGACWDITNCAYNHTYSGQMFETNTMLGMDATGRLKGQGMSGIMDMTDSTNPFKDWTIVWIPYCTADLGAGQRDNEYVDDYGTSGTYPGDRVTIRHRGLVNVKMVLQWLQTNITTPPDKLFVTGSSAGSYSAMLSFPMIRSQFNSAATKAYVLGDAGEGVSGIYNDGVNPPQQFMQLVENIWGLELPNHDVEGSVFYNRTPADYGYIYKNVIQAIVSAYPNDRFAQYTTKWDKTQVWFYDIQKDNNIHKPDTWGAESDASALPSSAISQEWNAGMMDAINITGANYWYYIGPGTHHTVDLSTTFYTESADGTTLLSWVNSFVNDGAMASQNCTQAVCDQP